MDSEAAFGARPAIGRGSGGSRSRAGKLEDAVVEASCCLAIAIILDGTDELCMYILRLYLHIIFIIQILFRKPFQLCKSGKTNLLLFYSLDKSCPQFPEGSSLSSFSSFDFGFGPSSEKNRSERS